MKEKNRKILIAITSVLLVLLIVVGMIMLLNQSDNKNEKEKEKNKVENTRCIEQLCVNKISTDDETGNSLIIVLKNEGQNVIKDACVNLKSETNNIELCVTDLEPNGEITNVFDKREMGGDKIEDFSLEKVEKKTTEE